MEDRKQAEERPEKRREERSEKEPDPYAPRVLKEGPETYRFEDWASI